MKLMPTFCRKPQIAIFHSSLIQPYKKLCHRQSEFGQKDRHTYGIKYVRFRRYVCISFAIFLFRKKYIAQLKQFSGKEGKPITFTNGFLARNNNNGY